MDVYQLRCFVAVAEELHFGRAAHRLHMTQPPLSRQVRSLEDELGLTLFDRSTRSVHLTPAGSALLPKARQALAAMAETAAHARLLADGTGGRVRIGFTSGASYGFVPRFVASIAAAMPDLDLTLLEMGTNDQVAALATGQLDLAVIRPLESRGTLTLTCVARESLRLALPRSHRLARLNRAIRAGDFAHEPFLAYSPAENLYFHALVSTAMHAAAFTPVHVQHVRSIHAMLSLVGAGIGLAIVPDVSRYFRFSGVCLKPLAAPFTATADLYMAWHADRLSNAARRITTEILPRSQ